jgi:hypothetical protein
MCDLETSRVRRPWPTLGRSATRREKNNKKEIIMVGITGKFFISIACPFAVGCAIRRGSVHTIKKIAEALVVGSYGD